MDSFSKNSAFHCIRLIIMEGQQLGFGKLSGYLAVKLKPLLHGEGQFIFLKTKPSHSSGIVVYPPKLDFVRN